MPFSKADKNINRAGRPKDKTYSYKLREQITSYCEENLSYFLEEIKGMRNGHAKSQAFLTLLNYVLPKLTESNSVIDIDKLTSDEVDKLFNKISDGNK